MSRDLARGNVSGGVIIKPQILLCIWKIYSREMQLVCTFSIDINAVSKNCSEIQVNLEKVFIFLFFSSR